MKRVTAYLGFLMREDGAFLAYAGRSEGEPIRAANAFMGWGDSAPIRANSAVADLGRPKSISRSCVCACGAAFATTSYTKISDLVDRAITAPPGSYAAIPRAPHQLLFSIRHSQPFLREDARQLDMVSEEKLVFCRAFCGLEKLILQPK